MKPSRLLYVLLTVQTAALGYLLLQRSESVAVAQVPDQGAQLQVLIDQTKSLNAKVDRIVSILESGKLQVTAKKAE